ncbi:hypothetical protein AB0V80_26170, partial [Escherichia coli]
RRRRDILLEEVLRQAGIPLLRSHDARKLLQMTGEWLNAYFHERRSLNNFHRDRVITFEQIAE